MIAGNILSLCPGQDDAWQTRTALLFMQLGWQVSRHILRERDRQQRQIFSNSR